MLRSAAFAAAAAALLWAASPSSVPPPPSDPAVAAAGARFGAAVADSTGLSVDSVGALRRDRDTTFWSMFTDKFGSNPNTPYMWNTLPLMGRLLPSPMWNLGSADAVVLVARVPPAVEYFSFTTFALFMPGRASVLPFSSLGDSVNNLNLKHTEDGLFAHVVTGNAGTFARVEAALVASGLPQSAINLAAVPSDVGLFDDALHLGGQVRVGTYFETVLRLFRFENQTDGDAYLASHPPVFYVKGDHDETVALPTRYYKDRAHPDNAVEAPLEADFAASGTAALARLGSVFRRELSGASAVPFGPLRIRGLDCLKGSEAECLGDCPDAAYFGPGIREDSDAIDNLLLRGDDEMHLVTLANHRYLNVSVYGSIAVLRPSAAAAPTLSKSQMKIRATGLGVTSFDFPAERPFVNWVFTRNPDHCARLATDGAVDGCSVILDEHVARHSYLTYCERVYLNPVTGTGPDWAQIIPARLYHLELGKAVPSPVLSSPLWPSMYANEPLRFLHIIKTGGESLEHYLAGQPMPKLDFSTCRKTAKTTGWTSAMTEPAPLCLAAATAVSSALCGINCECCAADVRSPDPGAFHGTLIRSPRAHALSLFSHGHTAHHSTWARVASDVPLYLAEGVLRLTEHACGSFCTGASGDWETALRERLHGIDPPEERESARPLRVLPIDNTQAHALTCSKHRGSLGHHFRLVGEASSDDALAPDLGAVLEALHRFEWVGITDLYEPSLCLLHFQANGTLPPQCDCNSPERRAQDHALGHWVETRSQRRSPAALAPDLLDKIDAHTAVDAQLFAAAVRLLLGRLRWVEETVHAEVLRCIDWEGLREASAYVPGMWDGGEGSLVG